uniref:Arrestin C-terminal-like domain-containing protein n=1 Tax=Neogobius melanostomus TaxID=47308 RepID=A0A8C6UTY3_9GOBI
KMPSIRNLTITYDVETLFVKAKGDVNVQWSEQLGESSYSAHRRLFKQKHFLIAEDTFYLFGFFHNFLKFTVTVNICIIFFSRNMPSSFRGTNGKVVYKLEAKLSRNWRIDRIVEKEIYFSTKSFLNIDQLMFPQTGSINKEVGIFSKGSVQMDATVDRRGYAPGDTVSINAKIRNSSSKDVTPKFSLIQTVMCCANGNTVYEKNLICKEVGGCVQPQTHNEVRSKFKIPSDAPLTINNCDILSVEYSISGYHFSSDPKVVFPVVLFSGGFSSKTTPSVSVSPVCPYAAGGAIGGPSSSDFPPPASTYPPSPHSGTSMHPATSPHHPASPALDAGAGAGLYPVPPVQFAGGYYNPVPQQPNPYGSPFSSSSSAPVFNPPPSASPTVHPPSLGPAPFSSAPPTYNTLVKPVGLNNTVPSPPSYPSAPLMPTLPSEISAPSAPLTENFLDQSDDKPPTYEILFPPSDRNN